MRHQKQTNPIILIVMTIIAATTFMLSTSLAGEVAINCQAHEGPCSLPFKSETMTLEIMPRPVTAMQESTFIIKFSGKELATPPYIDLGMPAMKMGPNRVHLKPKDDASYHGKGVIVRCKSGRRTWYANVVVPDLGEVKFVFDVVY